MFKWTLNEDYSVSLMITTENRENKEVSCSWSHGQEWTQIFLGTVGPS